MDQQDTQTNRQSLSPLQIEAWEVWNASFHVDVPDAYRGLAVELYRQDVRDRITTLFAMLDAQNARLDALCTTVAGAAGC